MVFIVRKEMSRSLSSWLIYDVLSNVKPYSTHPIKIETFFLIKPFLFAHHFITYRLLKIATPKNVQLLPLNLLLYYLYIYTVILIVKHKNYSRSRTWKTWVKYKTLWNRHVIQVLINSRILRFTTLSNLFYTFIYIYILENTIFTTRYLTKLTTAMGPNSENRVEF